MKIKDQYQVFVNRDNDMLMQQINSQLGYVDKTSALAIFNQYIGTDDRFVCMSRMRRSGKSVMAKTINAYYSCGCDSEEIFKNLDIGKAKSFKTHLNQYNTICFDAQYLISTNVSGELSISEFIEMRILEEFREKFPKIDFTGCDLPTSIIKVKNFTGRKFVVVIDEYDYMFRERRDDTKGKKDYVNLLRKLFKGDCGDLAIAFAFLTGILPINKDESESALNNFTQFNMVSPGPFSSCFGFTNDDVSKICSSFNLDFSEAKRWYDGYRLDNIELYNPNSIGKMVKLREYTNYWTTTASYTAILPYVKLNFDRLREDLIKLINGEPVFGVNTDSFGNDVLEKTFKSKSSVLIYLVHLGYLAYDNVKKVVYVPNEELRRTLKYALDDCNWDPLIKEFDFSKQILNAVFDGDEEFVATALDKEHTELTSILNYNNENSLSYVVYAAFYACIEKYFKPKREYKGGIGYADLVYLPHKSFMQDYPALVVELKWDKSATTAIDQIKAKGYCEGIKEYTDNILMVGINYDKKTKKHTCTIER